MPGRCVRGDVIFVNLDPAVGSEPKKTRPCLVVQNDTGNRFAPATIVAAITDADKVPKAYPVDVPIKKGEGGVRKDSVIQCSLLRVVDENRILETWGKVSDGTMDKVNYALRISLALDR